MVTSQYVPIVLLFSIHAWGIQQRVSDIYFPSLFDLVVSEKNAVQLDVMRTTLGQFYYKYTVYLTDATVEGTKLATHIEPLFSRLP